MKKGFYASNRMINNNTICIVGPTACHKSETALAIAKCFDCEIISADSVSVYRGLDIGSAKPTQVEQQQVRHHMIDCIDCTDESFSVSVFQSMAREAVDDCLSRGKLPLIVGGSGLYVDAIYSNLGFAYPKDDLLRSDLEARYEHNKQLAHQELMKVDSLTAAKLNPNDFKRVIRSLEVYHCSGRPMSSYSADFAAVQADKQYPAVKIGLNTDRDKLYQRINQRVDRMFDLGLLEEARGLYDSIENRSLTAMQAIGYAQLYAHFDGQYDLAYAKELIKRDTRRFAKRQLTWFKRDKDIKWFYFDANTDETIEAIINYIEEQLNECSGIGQ